MKMILLLLICLSMTGFAADSLTFIAHPDWHAGDLELGLVQPSNGTFAIQDTILRDMQQFGAKYILLSGDMIDGLWLTDTGERRSSEILKRKAYLKDKFAPGASNDELVLACGKVVYDGLNARFRRFGLEPIAAVGDHEVGDQNWTRGSPRANSVDAFKDAFARAYTLDAGGKPLYNGRIGSVPQRPVNTPYEHTAYAFTDQNVLFVTLDVYRYEGPQTTLHEKSGVVSIELGPEQAEWLDALLTETAKMHEIQFTVVQAHNPAMLPIRKVQTSCMMMNDRENSRLWKLLTQHDVDVYFSGEVHALTPQVDGTTAHIICGSFLGNTAHNYLVCTATDQRLLMQVREKVGDGSRYIYETTGEMVIDKSSGDKQITGSGRLAPLDLQRDLFHYSFDQADLSDGVRNSGQFGSRLYRGNARDAKLVDGVRGKSLLLNGESSVVYTRGKSPTDYDIARTLSAWVKTGQTGKGTVWALGNNDFCLFVNNGVLELTAEGKTLRAVQDGHLNDNTWHHVAAVYAGGPATLRGVQFYIDGKPIDAVLDGSDTDIRTNVFGEVYIGAQENNAGYAFQGALDEMRLWVTALDAAEISALYKQENSRME